MPGLPAALGDLEIVAGDDGVVTLRRRIRWRFLFPYALIAGLMGVLVYKGCADPDIAYLAPLPALVLAVLFGGAVFVLSAYGGLAPRVIQFDPGQGKVTARGHDAFSLPVRQIAELRAEWKVHHPGTLARRKEPLLVAELLLVPREGERDVDGEALELEPFAEGQAKLGSPEAEELRRTVGAVLEGLAARMGRPCRQLEAPEP